MAGLAVAIAAIVAGIDGLMCWTRQLDTSVWDYDASTTTAGHVGRMDTLAGEDIPVASLYPDRYGLSRSAVYEAMKELEITPFKKGKQAFIALEVLRELDHYIALKKGNPDEADRYRQTHLRDASRDTSADASKPFKARDSAIVGTRPADALLETLATAIHPTDILYPQRVLAECSDKGWPITTQQLKVVGVRPVDGSIAFGRWQLQRLGKHGREILWEIVDVSG